MLLAVCSVLAVSLFFSLKVNLVRVAEMANATQAAKRVAAKPLPDKTIPAPPVVPVASSIQAESLKSPTQFETNPADNGDAESELDKFQSEREKAREADIQKSELTTQIIWKTNLPLYNFALESLQDNLRKEAAKRGDGIAKTDGYFQCLPSTINVNMKETKVAEIRFQTKTNVDFTIMIAQADMGGDTGQSVQRPCWLQIRCSCGVLQIYRDNLGSSVMREIHISAFGGFPQFNDNKPIPSDSPHKFIDEGVKFLIGAQLKYLNQTNSSQ